MRTESAAPDRGPGTLARPPLREDAALDLRSLLRIIGRRKWLIVGSVAAFALFLGPGLSLLLPPTERVTALVQLSPVTLAAITDPPGVYRDANRTMATELEIIRNRIISEEVDPRLDFRHRIEVNELESGDAVRFSAEARTASGARQALGETLETYLSYRRSTAIRLLDQVIEASAASVAELEPQQRQLAGQMLEAAQRAESAPTPEMREAYEQELATLNEEVQPRLDAVGAQLYATRKALRQFVILRSQADNTAVVQSQGEPVSVFPRLGLQLGVGMVLGLLVGLVLAFTLENLGVGHRRAAGKHLRGNKRPR